MAAATHAEAKPADSAFSQAVAKAAKRALGGGIAGAAAMATQVLLLMPLRTTMNVQYRKGGTTANALKTLYAEGGMVRFYRGLGPALIQAPLSRFGDTAANAGALTLLGSLPQTAHLPVAVQTAGASILAASFRMLLVPVDTVKTIMQVEGKGGLATLRGKMATHGPGALFHGAFASAGATAVGHWPWFATYNTLQQKVPKPADHETAKKLGRNAAIGFVSTVVSDSLSNSVRVVKTYRQTAAMPIPYAQCVREIIAADGVKGLLWRGLGTRILANGLQGLTFSVLWKLIEERITARQGA